MECPDRSDDTGSAETILSRTHRTETSCRLLAHLNWLSKTQKSEKTSRVFQCQCLNFALLSPPLDV